MLGAFPLALVLTSAGCEPPPESNAAAPTADESSAESSVSPERKPVALPVEGVVVERAPFIETLRATGRLEANRRAELSFALAGEVAAVHVREGDRVRRGQKLATLDRRPLEISRDEARAALARAESDLALLALPDSTSGARRRLIEDRTGVTAAKAGLARAELDLERAELRAPFAGEVGRVDVTTGERAGAERTVLTLIEARPVRVRAEVLESDFAQLAPGAAVRVRVPAHGEQIFAGSVGAIEPEIDPERGTGTVLIELPNEDGALRPGMYAQLEIDGISHADRLSVPRASVLERDRKTLVFRARDGRAEWQYVELGLETRDFVEITNGLAPADTVLIGGHLTLAHGAPVKVKVQ